MSTPRPIYPDQSVKRVLVYRLGSLGDTVVALPALHLVARAFPNAERRMLTNVPVNTKAPAASAVLEGTGLIHGYMSYTAATRALRQLIPLWWQVLRWRPQVVVHLAASRGVMAAKRDARFFSVCGIRRQIGVPLTESMQNNRWRGDEQQLEPEAARLVRNLAELGEINIDDPANWNLRLSDAEVVKAREDLRPAGEMPIIAVSIGTKVQAKDWGVENWRRLLQELAVLFPSYALVLCGAAEEAEASEFAAVGWRSAGGALALNLCGKLSPRESAAVFAKARVFIGHDSGPMHLAAAVQTPCVAVFSARNRPRVWFPYGLQHHVLYHRVDCWGCKLETCIAERKKCILSITVPEVLAEIQAVLNRDQ